MDEASSYGYQEFENELSRMHERLIPDENVGPPTEDPPCDQQCEELFMFLDWIDEMVTLYGLIPLSTIGIIFNFASIGALFNNTLHLRRSLIQLFIFLNTSDVLFLIFFFLSFCMPRISVKYEQEAMSLIPYILPLLQTSLTISVYSTVAITLHGLHEIQKSAKMTSAMSPCPSNVNGGDFIEYESMVTAAGTTATIGTSYKFPQSSSLSGPIEGRSSSARNISPSADMFEGKSCLFCSRLLKKWGTRFTMFLVLIFGFGFNSPRWFEWDIEYITVKKPTHIPQDAHTFNNTLVDNNDDTTDFDQNSTYQASSRDEKDVEIEISPSSLAKNKQYFLHYQLIASCIVMILIPAVILLKAYCAFRKATPSRANKNKTHKIMLIIISMFVICHCPKVIITAYEIISQNPQHLWATWVRILKQVSQVLLVAYSALNPVAYCGELVIQLCCPKFLRANSLYKLILKYCCCREPQTGASQQSELDMMKSVGITLNGADPIQQQLEELDVQSRILSGLPISPPTSLPPTSPKYF